MPKRQCYLHSIGELAAATGHANMCCHPRAGDIPRPASHQRMRPHPMCGGVNGHLRSGNRALGAYMCIDGAEQFDWQRLPRCWHTTPCVARRRDRGFPEFMPRCAECHYGRNRVLTCISAITLATHDMARAVAFYEALGFVLKFGGPAARFTRAFSPCLESGGWRI